MGNESSKVVSTRTNSNIVIAASGKTNLAVSRGDAQADVVKRGKTAIAMAKGPQGSAWVKTNGKRTEYGTEGNGRVVAGGGVAYASAGENNQAIAYANRAAKKAVKKGYGSDLYQIDGSGRQTRYLGN